MHVFYHKIYKTYKVKIMYTWCIIYESCISFFTIRVSQITPTSGICEQTSWKVCIDLSTYFVFIPMLSISRLAIWYPVGNLLWYLYSVTIWHSKRLFSSCFVLTSFIKSLHSETFKTDLTFFRMLSKYSAKRSSTPKGKRILHLAACLV